MNNSSQLNRTVLGLDIGTTSIGWCLIEASESEAINNGTIKGIGVRLIPEGDDVKAFEKGKSESKAAARRGFRSMRRNLQRYKVRRASLQRQLQAHGMLPDAKLLRELTATELYGLRAKAVTEPVSLEELGRIILHINQRRGFRSSRKAGGSEEEKATDYKQKIKDLEAAMDGRTPGQYFFEQLAANQHYQVRNQVVQRRAIQQEFDRIWQTQQQFHAALSPDLYEKLGKRILFYQRPLRSATHLIGKCRYESWTVTKVGKDGKEQRTVVGKPCAAISHPVAQEFRIWQTLANIKLVDTDSGEETRLNSDHMQTLANEFAKTGEISVAKIQKILKLIGNYKTNYDRIKKGKDGKETNEGKIKGNTTLVGFRKALDKSLSAKALEDFLKDSHKTVQLWHLLFSVDDPEQLRQTLSGPLATQLFGNAINDAAIEALLAVDLKPDRTSLSVHAMELILPFLKQGYRYDEAVQKVSEKLTAEGKLKKAQRYQHHSVAAGERQLIAIEKIAPVRNGSLRNPIVEKIVNETLAVVKAICETYGRPDEIRVELARELKATKEDREKMDKSMREGEKANKEITEILIRDFNIPLPSKNDITRYKLWKETNGKSLYTGETIPQHLLFNNNAYQIEHIIPRSRLFDDSYGNKTIAETAVNRDKGNMTAFEYMMSRGEGAFAAFKERVMENKGLSRRKRDNLLRKDVPTDFISRQLNDTRYISKVVKEQLGQIAPKVTATTGSITDYLRNEWGLVDIIRYLHKDRFERDNKIVKGQRGSGTEHEMWEGFSKRIDHRHHAIDALVIACTTQSMIQRLNSLNAKTDEVKQAAIDKSAGKEMGRTPSNRKFNVPWEGFQRQAKEAIEGIAVSFKARKRLHTRRTNTYPPVHLRKAGQAVKKQVTYGVRQRLHEETIYGKIARTEHELNKKTGQMEAVVKEYFVIRKSLDKSFDRKAITEKVVDDVIQKRLLAHLEANGGNPDKAFSNLTANPVWADDAQTIPIKKVRIYARVTEAKELWGKDANGERVLRGYVNPGNNYVFALYGPRLPLPTDKRGQGCTGISISAMEANERLTQTRKLDQIVPAEYNSQPLLYTLQQGQMVVRYRQSPDEIDWNDTKDLLKRLYVVRKFTGSELGLVKYQLAGITPATGFLGNEDLFGDAWRPTGSSFYAIPVMVDILGNIHKRL